VKVRVSGYKELQQNIDSLIGRVGYNVADAIDAGCDDIRNSAIRSINEVSSGATVIRYRRGGASYEHTASRKGDAPNKDSGDLVNNIVKQLMTDSGMVGVTNAVKKYAQVLEDTSKLNRPFLIPAMDKNADKIRNRIAKAIAKSYT
jgi:hypothetical protein